MKAKPSPTSLTLRILPDAVLRRPCDPVECFDSWLQDVLAEMLMLMVAHDGCGLAGPQVGISQRLFVARFHRRTICLMNPMITACEGSVGMSEGCLSVPETQVQVPRKRGIDVVGYDSLGTPQTYHLQGFWARIVQHEIDHLNGILIVDYQDKERPY